MLAFLVIFDRCVGKLSLLSKVIPSTCSCLLFLRVSFLQARFSRSHHYAQLEKTIQKHFVAYSALIMGTLIGPPIF